MISLRILTISISFKYKFYEDFCRYLNTIFEILFLLICLNNLSFISNWLLNRYDKIEDSCFIICKRLKLKWEESQWSYNYKDIKSKFFLPGFLPIYATIPEAFKRTFEDDFEQMRNKTFKLVNEKLSVDTDLLIKDLTAGLKSLNNSRYYSEIVSKIPSILKILSPSKPDSNDESDKS